MAQPVRSSRKVLVGKFGLWIGWLYLNSPILFIDYLSLLN